MAPTDHARLAQLVLAPGHFILVGQIKDASMWRP
jgi:hypothetical protein